MIIKCPKCGRRFDPTEDTLWLGGETPSETIIVITCPECGYEEDH